jgi:hypothetical protein
MQRRLFLHIGTHKTGTTSIQWCLARNRDVLHARGLFVPGAHQIDPYSGHHNLPWLLIGDPRYDPGLGDLDSLFGELKSVDGDAVLSSEDLESLTRSPATIDGLARRCAAEGFEMIAVVYLRDQFDYATSLFVELLKHGYTGGIDEFLATIERDRAISFEGDRGLWYFDFDYHRLLSCWSSVVGDRMRVCGYDVESRHGDLVPSFFRCLGIDDLTGIVDMDVRINARAPSGAVDLAHLARRRDQFRRIFAPSNRMLREAYGVAVPAA